MRLFIFQVFYVGSHMPKLRSINIYDFWTILYQISNIIIKTTKILIIIYIFLLTKYFIFIIYIYLK
jgi:hypothetical protein